jgi:hypothetical protein
VQLAAARRTVVVLLIRSTSRRRCVLRWLLLLLLLIIVHLVSPAGASVLREQGQFQWGRVATGEPAAAAALARPPNNWRGCR